MTNFAIVHTDLLESSLAGRALGLQIREAFVGEPDVVLLFASPLYDHAELLRALKQTSETRLLLGCSSAGEFTNQIRGQGLACAVAFQSEEMQFSLSVGRGLHDQPELAARQIVSTFTGFSESVYRYRTALVFIDALHGCANTLIECLTLLTKGMYQFFGGGAGDNAQFAYTPVFEDTNVLTDAAVVLEILSQKPIGIGASHSWQPNGELMRVTGSKGLVLESLDGRPAIEAFQLYALETFQPFDLADPLPFFLINVLGIEIGRGYHQLRVPIAVQPDGSILCAAEVPLHTSIRFMSAAGSLPATAATEATEGALRHLYGSAPAFALFFDCVATRLRLGVDFDFELGAVNQTLEMTPYVGCNTHGQVARFDGQYSGFLHCTAVVCVFPQ